VLGSPEKLVIAPVAQKTVIDAPNVPIIDVLRHNPEFGMATTAVLQIDR